MTNYEITTTINLKEPFDKAAIKAFNKTFNDHIEFVYHLELKDDHTIILKTNNSKDSIKALKFLLSTLEITKILF